MRDRAIVLSYLFLLAFHVAHVFEEIWGRFWLIGNVFDIGHFLLINWVLFLIPLCIFYFVLRESRRAYVYAILYGGIMVANGLGHGIMTVITGRYFDGFAGAISGIGLIPSGLFLLFAVLRKIRQTS